MPLLYSAGHAARVVDEGGTALEQLKDEHPLLIIVGGAADLDLYFALRCASVAPILALVSETDRDRTLAAFAAGVDDYQLGPISHREIVARVSALLRSTRRSLRKSSA